MEFLARVLYVIDSISVWCGKVSIFFLLALMSITMLDVILRYVFNNPTIWGMESSCMLLVAVSLLGGGYCMLAGQHVKVDIIYQRWTPRVRAAVDLFTQFALFSMCFVLFYYGGKVALNSFIHGDTSTGAWVYPLWPSQALVPIGALVLGLQGLARWVRDLVTVVTGEKKLESRVDLGMKVRVSHD